MSNRAPESDLWDALRGALVTRALGIVSDLGIPQKLAELLMLALFAGRERDVAQWRELLEGNGFEPTSIEHELIQARCR